MTRSLHSAMSFYKAPNVLGARGVDRREAADLASRPCPSSITPVYFRAFFFKENSLSTTDVDLPLSSIFQAYMNPQGCLTVE